MNNMLKLSDLLLNEALESEDWEADSDILDLADSELNADSDDWDLPACSLNANDPEFAGCDSCQ
jgi:hypothetical protein